MKYYPVRLKCDKGHEMTMNYLVLAADNTMRIEWVCVKCGSTKIMEYDLAGCVENCRRDDEIALAKLDIFTTEDTNFLKAFHISVEQRLLNPPAEAA